MICFTFCQCSCIAQKWCSMRMNLDLFRHPYASVLSYSTSSLEDNSRPLSPLIGSMILHCEKWQNMRKTFFYRSQSAIFTQLDEKWSKMWIILENSHNICSKEDESGWLTVLEYAQNILSICIDLCLHKGVLHLDIFTHIKLTQNYHGKILRAKYYHF